MVQLCEPQPGEHIPRVTPTVCGTYFNTAISEQHGVDTAKYYKAAEEELEKERLKKAGY